MSFRNSLPALFFVLTLLSGCSTPQPPPATIDSLAEKGVAPSTAAKIKNSEALDYEDILDLLKKGVSSEKIIPYLQSTMRIYRLGPVQLQALQQAGGSTQLINYLQETEGFYGKPNRKSRQQSLTPEQANSPLYQDEQPFAYNPPVIDDFYDSSYEESLYSPFSYN